jgi:hypothetical protein
VPGSGSWVTVRPREPLWRRCCRALAHVAIIPASDLELLEALEDRIDLDAARRALASSKGQRVAWEDLKAELGL